MKITLDEAVMIAAGTLPSEQWINIRITRSGYSVILHYGSSDNRDPVDTWPGCETVIDEVFAAIKLGNNDGNEY